MLGPLFNKVMELAFRAGFSGAGTLDPGAIVLREEARRACAENKCGAYHKRWSCPPGCGSLGHWAARLRGYTHGLLMQTTGFFADPFDYEAMMSAGKKHTENLARFAVELSTLYPAALVLGAGPC